jgi:hypothetical protein
MANRALGEFGHVEAEAEEVDVDNRGEERVLEGQGAKDHADEDEKLSICNHTHSRVIVRCKRAQF